MLSCIWCMNALRRVSLYILIKHDSHTVLNVKKKSHIWSPIPSLELLATIFKTFICYENVYSGKVIITLFICHVIKDSSVINSMKQTEGVGSCGMNGAKNCKELFAASVDPKKFHRKTDCGGNCRNWTDSPRRRRRVANIKHEGRLSGRANCVSIWIIQGGQKY